MINRSRKMTVEEVRTLGLEITNNAEDIVGNNITDLASLDIWIRIHPGEEPSYEVSREYVPRMLYDEETNSITTTTSATGYSMEIRKE